MPLTFKDTLTQKPSAIATSGREPVDMYVCGPTVYAKSHVGHARTYLLFDVIKRYLLSQGAQVHHVQNITDFEDKITKTALAEGIAWDELSRRETRSFCRAISSLNIIAPDHIPLSSHYARQMIRLIRTMEKRGFTYSRNGSIYFDASSVSQVTNFSAEDMLSAHAVPEPGQKARPEANDPRDFVLWKPSHAPAPSWESPWGLGQPGWHIECYAMASNYFTLPMDLHGGGLDLIFPHHYAENLISMALNGTIISKNFVHQAFVTMDSRKMAKSTGNLVTIEDALKEVSPGGLRAYLMCRDYEESLEFSMYEARQVDNGWKEATEAFQGLLSPDGGTGYPVERLRRGLASITRSIGHNIGTRRAMLELQTLADDIRRSGSPAIKRGETRVARKLLTSFEVILGLPLTDSTGEMKAKYVCPTLS